MRVIAALFLSLAALLAMPGNALARESVTVIEEEWDEASGRWVETARYEEISPDTARDRQAERASARPQLPRGKAARTARPLLRAGREFGVFRVLDESTALLDGITDHRSPADFATMVEAHPGLKTLRFGEAPGTRHDIANMKLGRMIRAAGLFTHVPRGGSVRSGAVELFFAGSERQVDDGAEFAVHSWRDPFGRQAGDVRVNHRAHRDYVDYYIEMGLEPARARAFYDLTNSAAFEDALWLDAADMRFWSDAPQPLLDTAPRIAYIDSLPLLD